MERNYSPDLVRTMMNSNRMQDYSDGIFQAGISWKRKWDRFVNHPFDFIPALNLPISNRTYYGPVYRQDAGTCFAWSAGVNAITALGLDPDLELVSNLLNGTTERGPTDNALVSFFRTLKEQRFFVDRFVNLGFNSEDDAGFGNNFWYPFDAGLIRDLVDEGEVILSVLKSNRYYRRSAAHEDHVICLVGYDIHPGYNMYIQVLDSNHGNIWFPLHFISRASREYITFKYKGDLPRQDWYQKPEEPRHIPYTVEGDSSQHTQNLEF